MSDEDSADDSVNTFEAAQTINKIWAGDLVPHPRNELDRLYSELEIGKEVGQPTREQAHLLLAFVTLASAMMEERSIELLESEFPNKDYTSAGQANRTRILQDKDLLDETFCKKMRSLWSLRGGLVHNSQARYRRGEFNEEDLTPTEAVELAYDVATHLDDIV